MALLNLKKVGLDGVADAVDGESVPRLSEGVLYLLADVFESRQRVRKDDRHLHESNAARRK